MKQIYKVCYPVLKEHTSLKNYIENYPGENYAIWKQTLTSDESQESVSYLALYAYTDTYQTAGIQVYFTWRPSYVSHTNIDIENGEAVDMTLVSISDASTLITPSCWSL